jgi:uncharacterized protein (TIGR02231 family)
MQSRSVLFAVLLTPAVVFISAGVLHATSVISATTVLRATGDEQNIVPSTLRSATVYRTGAELVHTATAVLKQGNNELVVEDISNKIDVASIQVGCSGNVTIMSVSFSTEYLKPESNSPLVARLTDSIASIKRELAKLDVLEKSNTELLDLLSANKHIGGAQNGPSVAELSKMVDYYKQKETELRSELNTWEEKGAKLNQSIGRLESQLTEEEKKNSKTAGRIILQLLSPTAGSFDLTVSYMTPSAYWNPSYDLKADNGKDPLRLVYKAKLVQTSGIDWKHTKLSLSTSIPGRHANAPIFKTWFLRFIDQVAQLEELEKSNSLSSVDGKVAGLDVRRSNSLDDVVVTGYGIKKDREAAAQKDKLSDYVSVNDNQMDVTFDIDIPYDIPGNGKEQGVVLKEFKVPCTYQYYAAPRLDKDVYLLGQLPDWEKLNLLAGEAGVIVEGTYIGKSYIDPGSTQDTLSLTLGKDKRVVVKREKVVDYSSVKFLGSNKKQVFTYEITVRNGKKENIQVLLKDQYPISSSKDIEEELLESSGAGVNNETGVLTWKVDLAPGESKKFRISYSVKYPKDKMLNIDGRPS